MSSAPQTSVDTPAYGEPGYPTDAYATRHNRVETYINEEASAHLVFGRLVKLGTADLGGPGVNGAKVPSTKADKLVGFVTGSTSYSRSDQLDGTGVLPKIPLGVTEKGSLWIMPEEDLVPGDAVHGRVIANSAKLPGMIGKTDDGVNTIDLVPFAQVRSAGGPTSGNPIRLTFDFTNAGLAVTDS